MTSRGWWAFHRILRLAWALLVIPLPARGQDILDFARTPLRVWAEREGLPSITPTALTFDAQGYLWVGTQGGLFRFNGRSFDQHDPSDIQHSQWIKALLQTADGSFWIGRNHGGLSRVRNGHSTHFESLGGQVNLDVVAFAEAPDRTLFAGTSGGLFRFDGQGWISMSGLEGARSDVLSLTCTGAGSEASLWVGTRGGLGKWAQGRWQWFGTREGLPDPRVPALAPCREDGSLWVGTGKGLVRLVDGKILAPPVGIHLPTTQISLLALAPAEAGGTLWVGTPLGLGIWAKGQWKFLDRTSGMPAPDVYSLNLVTPPGRPWTAWVGTGSGLVQLRSGGWSPLAPPSDPLFDSPWGLAETSTPPAFWVGTNAGLYRFMGGGWKRFGPGEGFSGQGISVIHPEGKGLWIGGLHGEVGWVQDGRVTYLPPLPDRVYAFLKSKVLDPEPTLWVGTLRGLYRWKGGAWDALADRQAFPRLQVTGLLEVRDLPGPPTLLVACRGEGLAALAGGQVTWLPKPLGVTRWDLNQVLASTDAQGDRWLWAASWNQGLHRTRWQGTELRWERVVLEEPDESPRMLVYSLRADAQGRIYAFTSAGVVRLTPGAPSAQAPGPLTRRVFTTGDGLPFNDNNQCGGLVDAQGRVFASAANELAVLDPSEERPDNDSKPLHLETFTAAGRDLPRDGGEFSAQLRDFRVTYALLSYHRPEDIRYRTQLVGLEPEPSVWTAQAFREFPTLPPGPYTFQVWGRDYAGNLSGPVSLSFRMLPPLWQRPWAYALYALLLGGQTWAVVRWRGRQQARAVEALEQRIEERTMHLARVNAIVQSINEKLDVDELLSAILEGTQEIHGIQKASALVRHTGTGLFTFRAAVGWDVGELQDWELSLEDAEERYVQNTQALDEDIFLIRDIPGRPGEARVKPLGLAEAMLVVRIRVDGRVEAFFIFENMDDPDAFEDQDVELLKGLKQHFISAFTKVRILERLTGALQATQEAQALAEAATRSKSEFLANMSHEIRTPMNAIIGFSQLGQKLELPPKPQDYFRKIATASKSLLGIINDILDFSKVEAGKLELEHVPFHLVTVLSNVTDLFAHAAADKGLELLLDLEPGLPTHLVGDPLRLSQVFINLLGNALKFTEQGQVVVRARIQAQLAGRVALRFAIEDSGIGMSGDQAGRLFQAFSQADSSTTRKFGGTGLGLVISQRLVALMGGDIRVESEQGRGSTFIFSAEFGVESETAATRLPTALKVLVVDDHPTARAVLEAQLSHLGCAVTLVPGGEAALAQLQREPFDVVLMDWRMPGLDGIETTRRLHALPGLENTPTVIMVTAHAREAVWPEARNAGIRNCLLKPVNPELLQHALAEAMGWAPGPTTTPATRPEGAAALSLPRLRVLLVEDNLINQEVAKELLATWGVTPRIAGSGPEALRILETEAFDLVLMDVQMPEMDGYETTGRIRQMAAHADLPILAMTANVLERDRQACLEAGMNDFLPKPIDPEELLAALRRWSQGFASASGRAPSPESAAPPVEAPLWDRPSALRRLGGNQALLDRLVEDFRREQAGTADVIAEALTQGDVATAERLAHTIKGVAGNLGARRLQEVSGRVEQTLRAGSPEVAWEGLDALARVLRDTLAAPSGGNKPATPSGASANEDPGALLRELYARLRAGDPGAEALLPRLRRLPPGHLDLQALECALQDFDFTAALSLLPATSNPEGHP